MEENPLELIEIEGERLPIFYITKRWKSSFNRLCNDFFPKYDIIIFQSIKENEQHMEMFFKKIWVGMRYFKKGKEWEDEEEVNGSMRKIIKVRGEKIGACRR